MVFLSHLCVADDEGCVSRHEEVTPGCGNQRCHQPDEVIVHVARVPQGGGRGGHNCADDGVKLPHGGVGDAQAIDLYGEGEGEGDGGVERRDNRLSAQSQILPHLLSVNWIHLTDPTVISAPPSPSPSPTPSSSSSTATIPTRQSSSSTRARHDYLITI